MAFVNEYISDEDFEKYNFEKINNRRNGGGNPAYDWTVDKDNEVWLRHFYKRQDHTAPDGGFTGENTWDFYWKGFLMSIETNYIDTKPHSSNHGIYYAHIQITSINIPECLSYQEIEILEDIKQAFIIYAGGGIFSKAIGCNIDLEYKGELI